MSWYSATLRLGCLIEPNGLTRYMDSVHVFQASDYDAALQRALQIGRTHEESYVNGDGAQVKWRLASVVTLDLLGDFIQDGAEVCSGPVDTTETVPFDHVFIPEESNPTQSI